MQRTTLHQERQRLFDRRPHVRSRRRRRFTWAMWRPLKIKAVDPRKKCDVSVDQQLPLFRTAPPRQRLRQSVTRHAGARDFLVGNFFVHHAMLWEIFNGLGLFRRESLLVAKVAKNLAGVVGFERNAVQPDHSLDGFFPAFGSGANPRDARYVALSVRRVAPTALT